MQKYFYVLLTSFVLGILFVGYILFTPENEIQKIILEIGETHLLDAKQNVIFESDNNLIATVESNSGLITAISVGTTRVTAKKNNKIILTYLVEVKSGLGSDKNMRQAICQIDKNNFILITTTVGTNNRGGGLSLTQLAVFMKDYSCRTGLNLDGGGSTAYRYKTNANSLKKVYTGYDGRGSSDMVYFVEQ